MNDGSNANELYDAWESRVRQARDMAERGLRAQSEINRVLSFSRKQVVRGKRNARTVSKYGAPVVAKREPTPQQLFTRLILRLGTEEARALLRQVRGSIDRKVFA